MLTVGHFYKHFKGSNLVERNIYKILAINPKYTGENEYPDKQFVVYESIFQNGLCFIREYDDLAQELSDEEKEKYNQTYRIEELNEEELQLIMSDDFIKEKMDYIDKKYKSK